MAPAVCCVTHSCRGKKRKGKKRKKRQERMNEGKKEGKEEGRKKGKEGRKYSTVFGCLGAQYHTHRTPNTHTDTHNARVCVLFIGLFI